MSGVQGQDCRSLRIRRCRKWGCLASRATVTVAGRPIAGRPSGGERSTPLHNHNFTMKVHKPNKANIRRFCGLLIGTISSVVVNHLVLVNDWIHDKCLAFNQDLFDLCPSTLNFVRRLKVAWLLCSAL